MGTGTVAEMLRSPSFKGGPVVCHHILFCLTSVIDSYTTLNMVWDKCTIVPRLFAVCDSSHAMSSRQSRPLPPTITSLEALA